MSDPVLELRSVSKQFPGHLAVDQVSLAVERGTLFSLVGPSGCGKTTTLRLVAGFEQPEAGEILLNGRPVSHLPPYQRSVSTVFQSYALFPHLTARQNVEFGLRRRGAAEIEERVQAMFSLVLLEGKESRKPGDLSGGERQRVALARSLILEPDVLLLDEPLAALDPNLRKQVRSELLELQRRTGVTFLLVTHDREEALSMPDVLAVMNRGRLEQTGAPRELYRHPRTRFVAEFLGAVNWIGGAGVRPESISLGPSQSHTRPAGGDGAAGGEGPVRGVVERVEFLGASVRVGVRLASGEGVIAEEGPGMGRRPGEEVALWWRREDEIRVAG